MAKSSCFTPDHSIGGRSSQESQDTAPRTPLLSILNVVVDHVMMPPSPMEPMEFREVCRWNQEQTTTAQCCREDGTGNKNDIGCNNSSSNGGLFVPSSLPTVEEEEEGPPSSSQTTSHHDAEFHQPSGAVGDEPVLPSPLSTENIDIMVPILRVFGPVLRDGNYEEFINSSQVGSSTSSQQSGDSQSTSTTNQQKQRIQQPQSGCLHIHGAFPYMLGRPIIAGPDGSMHHGYNCDTRGRIDWDDASSVSNILEEVHCRLEMALRASYEHNNIGSKKEVVIPGAAVSSASNRDGDNQQKDSSSVAATAAETKTKSPTKTPLFIRQVTIVTGRGFYTYCSGPPAPFLRVEYYDPKMRWRVKMVLERGLELNELYHPDPRQYDYTDPRDEEGCEIGGPDIRPLKFRCYEAHIPYTMQVFKDCNLAGMKYIKVGEARFRNPLPRGLRKRTKEEFSASKQAFQMNETSFFLSHTVPAELVWPKLEDMARRGGAKLDEYWVKKQTCCDVELDSTVQQLLNVLDVMTELPSPLEERQKIHWRAVPSLREIWEQERKRMSILLPPENDFLSCKEEEEEEEEVVDSDESDNDDIDDGEIINPAQEKLAAPQFTLNVKKGESLPGSRLALKGMKNLFGTSIGLEADFRRALRDILLKHKSFIDDVDVAINGKGGALANANANANANAGSNASNIFQTNEGISQVNDVLSSHDDVLTPSLHDGIEALAALGDQFSQSSVAADEDASPRATNRTSCFPSPGLRTPIARTLSTIKNNYDAAPLSQKDVDEEIEMLTFGEQVDSGAIVHRETIMNPSTLSPYDDADEFDEEDDGFLVEEERLGEAGLEKALTQLATQAEPNEESNLDYVNDTEDSHLDINYHLIDLPGGDNQNELFSDDDCSDVQLKTGASIFEEAQTMNDKGGFRLSNLSQPTSEDTGPSGDVGRFVVEEYISSPQPTTRELGGLSQKHELKLPTSNFVVEPRKLSSLRCGEIRNQTQQSIPRAGFETCPPWFQFQWRSSGGAPPRIPNGSFLEPLKRPPSYSQVKSWLKANRKRSKAPIKHINAKQQKVAATDLSYDDSSGKNESQASAYLTAYTQYSQLEKSQETPDPLAGLGQQGCKVQVSSGGGLKTQINTSTTFTPLTIMSIEVHVQCRTSTGTKDRKDIALVPDSSRDAIFAAAYIYGRDPGGGESLEILERGCVLVTIEQKGRPSTSAVLTNSSKATIGLSSDVTVERVNSERNLLLRIASIVQLKDPDALVSWDTQGGGLGYIVERGVAIGKPIDGSNSLTPSSTQVDMARLLGRTPRATSSDNSATDNIPGDLFGVQGEDQHQKENGQNWSGSGLGSDWDERVGAGAAASSIVGRVVLCGWKICSEECKHPNASYQPAIVSAVLNKRIPFHDDLLLTKWYCANNGIERWRVIEYRLAQAMSNVLLFDALDVLGRAGEAARLSGVEFSQSLPGIRGSQYKVEGVLLRSLQSVHSNERGEKKGLNKDARWMGSSLTSSNESQSQSQSPWKLRRQKAQNATSAGVNENLGYFFYSPSKLDCSNQEALECQAMTLEPKSGFHFDPVVVCDFTALYPSLVIAYNFCYTTIAGKLDYHSTRSEMRTSGKTTCRCGPFFYSERRSAAVIKHHIKSLDDSNETGVQGSKRKRDRAYAIPTGTIFVSESVLKGVLPQVLDEMLSTRAMLKKAAKEYKKRVKNLSPAVLRQIEARQLALKYVANVTYGYTSATFSGRSAVPLVADAIVECGRRTLTNAINLANRWGREENGRWSGAQVLYGDTDSVFIKLPGRSVKEAWQFGEEYCKSVTASNPPPVQLKLEKVYSACLLQTFYKIAFPFLSKKKKYCGMMYESPTQKHPTFEAKGIETVRRDQCTITQRLLKNALTHVFQHGIGPAKDYLYRQWAQIHSGRLPVSDFVLTGRVRSRYRGGRVGPVQASLAKRLAEVDPGRVVRHKERLPYVIVAMPGRAFRLKDGVLTPLELLEQWDSYSINVDYYTVKHVNAALQRCFGLNPFKINIQAWYNSCPKPRRRIHHWPQSKSATSLMISSFFGSDACALCANKCKSTGSSRVVVCQRCKADGIAVAYTAIDRLKITQQQATQLAAVCSACNGCLESSGTFAREEIRQSTKRRENSLGTLNASSRRGGRLSTPIANCVCIDCPITYERHKIRESEIEAMELCQALDLN
ncbi:hypothetical protein ACHAXR_011801 [Thalassiosira sp. AJA248-18]